MSDRGETYVPCISFSLLLSALCSLRNGDRSEANFPPRRHATTHNETTEVIKESEIGTQLHARGQHGVQRCDDVHDINLQVCLSTQPRDVTPATQRSWWGDYVLCNLELRLASKRNYSEC
ncbi:hypothetical protein BKA65DRAFT_131471 [Rhexocercosporidium sp. MPI-PUGE-AT-0058]|nr:hypothetical protein BKA65DRAFT_131471 [Rhexocercosporidium sp. MPI-PUGE-AT-0058]